MSLSVIIGAADADPAQGPSFVGGDGVRRAAVGRARHHVQRRAIEVEKLVEKLEKLNAELAANDGTDLKKCKSARTKILLRLAELYPVLRAHAQEYASEDPDNFHRGPHKICNCALFTELVSGALVANSSPRDSLDLLCADPDFADALDTHPIVAEICGGPSAVSTTAAAAVSAAALREVEFGSPRFLPLLRAYLEETRGEGCAALEEPPRRALVNPLVPGQLCAEHLTRLVEEELGMIELAEIWEICFAMLRMASA